MHVLLPELIAGVRVACKADCCQVHNSHVGMMLPGTQQGLRRRHCSNPSAA
jgi:hypothetical protein